MNEHRFEYLLVVEPAGDGWRAYLDAADTPLQGHGPTPLQAVAALAETLREWPVGGADRWLRTRAGRALERALERRFVTDPFAPPRGGKGDPPPS